MKAAIVIPSRYASVRLPQKALHLIKGKILVQRVLERCLLAKGIDGVFVATDHEEIASAVRKIGGNVIMTDPDCASGTDRVAAAAKTLSPEFDIIINVQGDEPLIAPEVIDAVCSALRSSKDILVATPITEILNPDDLSNPNVVKVVRNTSGDALYFSRQCIPYLRDHSTATPEELLTHHPYWKHIGLYGYRRRALEQFSTLQESILERAERLEQLRLIESAIPIRCVEVEYESAAVDTIDDVYTVEAILEREGFE
jgi:3-deoxy-manno-octulosonate cytidylyltransferase (CMP-KDO synthetase)